MGNQLVTKVNDSGVQHESWCKIHETIGWCTCGAPAQPGALIDGRLLGIPNYRALRRASDALPERWRRIAAADLGGRELRRRLAMLDRAVRRLAAQAARRGMNVSIHWDLVDPYDTLWRRPQVTIWIAEGRRMVGRFQVAVDRHAPIWRREDEPWWRLWTRVDVVLRRVLRSNQQTQSVHK